MNKEPIWLGMLALAAASVYVGHYLSRPVEAVPVIVLAPEPEAAPPPPVAMPAARPAGPPSCDCGARPPAPAVVAKSKPPVKRRAP